jgi:dihydroorotase
MSAAAQIEQAVAELTQAQKELKIVIETVQTTLLARALESIEDRIHDALVKLGG